MGNRPFVLDTVRTARFMNESGTESEGTPAVPQPDQSLSQYSGWQFTDNPAIPQEAARKGSLCVQVFLAWQARPR
jgi:hypothetical protein